MGKEKREFEQRQVDLQADKEEEETQRSALEIAYQEQMNRNHHTARTVN